MPDTIAQFEFGSVQARKKKRFSDVRREAEAAEPIFTLWRQVIAARRAFYAAAEAESDLADIVVPQHPKRPDNLMKRTHGAERVTLTPLTRYDLEDWIDRARERNDRYAEEEIRRYERRLAALDAYEAECEAVNQRLGLSALREAATAAEAALSEAEARLTEATPCTHRGVAIKLRHTLRAYYFSQEEREESPAPKAMVVAIRDLVCLHRRNQQ
jgi:hypothetical protein